MQFTSYLALALTMVLATASPASSPSRKTAILRRQTADLCSGIDTPLCCQTDVDGVADLTCESPSDAPSTIADFETNCAATGLTAQCCTLPLAGDALLCTAV
ncbi:hypothetical protein K431DRAFT_316366 [Polychaeton citri CBS 116435]|uniref:Hydrophobin n=1 Tax=Polychaeton citri CBS 116435 TaxID=1314669 RepID=A0A9P4UL85_9PEZI|nr:hypothetical protein K431DRAFT_316366 [Polychaeton citri CBS 116435]